MRLPSTWAWEEEYPAAIHLAIGTDTVAAAAQAARAADQAEKKAQLQRLQTQESTQRGQRPPSHLSGQGGGGQRLTRGSRRCSSSSRCRRSK